MSATTPSSLTLPKNSEVLKNAFRMSNIERFLHLQRHAKLLVGTYGQYTTYSKTTVFARAHNPRKEYQEPTITELALSLAAAQDSLNSAQPDGPARDDLLLFQCLWEITIIVLEDILARGSLEQESFGWGIFGLSAGYIDPPANDLTIHNLFTNHKDRLHAALSSLPSLDPGRRRSEYVVSEKTQIGALVRARREIHTCGHILLHTFRQAQWRRVRWWHAIATAERWIGAFGLMPEEVPEEMPEEVHKKLYERKKTAPELSTFSFP
ncbi:hypothetical protein EJ02DRAFT_348045 [Clathrospora elynae]|uniref:Uncharacterized protein n=1 Tax=Clathrospora elynae TaxID=706981 RepID=A0A6A5SKX4_9PLEO|nr:hypothetical protein EJ02DRAFT_348045 [Clathrospora elynae]